MRKFTPPRRSHADRTELFEALETRLALYTSPLLVDLPEVASMANAQNTVVRMHTAYGNVDIELYDQAGPGSASAAPITTANFLNYIRSGRYDQTFFHRLVATPTPFVLQGGGYTFQAPSTAQPVVTFGNIQNEFDPGRSNVERTVAMAKLGGNPDSATSQFFFNLDDNASNLDGQNGGFTVFGKVIKGWEVIQTITALSTTDLNQFFGPNQNAFGQVPTGGGGSTDLITIRDIEVIKPGGQTEFYTSTVYYPDGFRSARITSTVDLLNPDPNVPISYEIIARFETGQRDRVIQHGTVEPGARLSIPISVGGDPTVNKIRPDTPFAYEIRATGPVAASLHHKDFGAVASENFIDPMHLTEAQLKDWSFAGGIKGETIPSYLVWESLSDETATITATFHASTGQIFTITKTLEPFRRGGLNINQLTGVPTGLFSVHVTSTEPIVAAMSQYRTVPGRASTELGMLEGGAHYGVLPGAIIPTDGQSIMSLIYTGAAPASVTVNISFVLDNGSVLQGTPQTLSVNNRRRDLDLSTLNGSLPRNTPFTIRYTVAGAAGRVAANYTSVTGGNTIRTSFQSLSTAQIHFADGFTNPASTSGSEVISLYNPFSAAGSEVTYRLRFHFTDGDMLPVNAHGVMGPNSRVTINVADLSDVMAKINSGDQFRRYSITVESDAIVGGQPVNGAIFGQLTRIGMGGETVTTGPTLGGLLPAVLLTDPRFT